MLWLSKKSSRWPQKANFWASPKPRTDFWGAGEHWISTWNHIWDTSKIFEVSPTFMDFTQNFDAFLKKNHFKNSIWGFLAIILAPSNWKSEHFWGPDGLRKETFWDDFEVKRAWTSKPQFLSKPKTEDSFLGCWRALNKYMNSDLRYLKKFWGQPHVYGFYSEFWCIF